jgi:hypothetical protein
MCCGVVRILASVHLMLLDSASMGGVTIQHEYSPLVHSCALPFRPLVKV